MVEWVLALLFQLQPTAPWTDDYPAIAQAIADASEADPLFKGDDGPKRTAAVLVAVAYAESRFDIEAEGDNSKSCGMHQIQPRTSGRYTCDELKDPDISAREAIRLIRQSLKICGRRPADERLAWYASGSCDRGLKASRFRIQLASRLAKK